MTSALSRHLLLTAWLVFSMTGWLLGMLTLKGLL